MVALVAFMGREPRLCVVSVLRFGFERLWTRYRLAGGGFFVCTNCRFL